MKCTPPPKEQIYNVISYSRLIAFLFNAGECILLHLWVNQNIEPPAELLAKYTELENIVFNKQWKRPEYKYDEMGRLWYRYKRKDNWTRIKD